MENEVAQNSNVSISSHPQPITQVNTQAPTQTLRASKKKVGLFVGAVALVLIFLGSTGFFVYKNFKQGRGFSYACSLVQSDCQRLENYQDNGWSINKVKVEPGYENFPNEVVKLSKKISSFTVYYSVVVSKEDKKIISRLPEPLIFNNVLQEAQKDNLLISLLDTGKPLDAKIIDRKLLPWEEETTHKGADYFEFVVIFSAGKDSHGVGCTKSYFMQFTESGEILKQEESSPYCPGPL